MLINKKCNWKYYFKWIVAILPILSIFTYIIGNGAEILKDSDAYWTKMLDGREDKFVEGFLKDSLLGWGLFDKLCFIVVRNVFLITTIGNVAAAIWFINSAMNNDKEGQGKFDNYFWGIIILTLIWWISVLYNLSLIVSDALSTMKWYSIVSWIFLHSVVQFLMLIYFVVFYKKYKVKKRKRNVAILWVYAQAPLTVYMLLFTAIGMIAKETNAFAFFGDMSSDGHFPYDFYDFTSDNTRVNIPGISPEIQYMLAFLALSYLIPFGFSYRILDRQTKV